MEMRVKSGAFRSVLFSPLGDRGNAAAARGLCDLVTRTGAELTMFGVVSEPSMLERALHRSSHVEALLAAETKAMETKLVRCRGLTEGVDIAIDVETGDPALAIIERVLRDGHDLVAVTTDEDDEDHATIKRLLRKCPCPVWVIRPSRARTQRVLAAVNPDAAEAELNTQLLGLAASMVSLRGGELHLVHAWELYGEATMRSSGYIHTSDTGVDALVEQERVHHRAAVNTLLRASGLADLPWQVHLEHGPAPAVIRSVVGRKRINLLVMGTVARTGVAGLIIGNTAEAVLDSVRCSVVAAKPRGFLTPLEHHPLAP